MRLEHAFFVPAAPERVWAFLLDVERVAPCMPGAELVAAVDERTWKGKVNVKLGPVSLSFAGTVVREETDEVQRRVVLRAQGAETRGKGTASAVISSQIEPADRGARVLIVTDLAITGAVAQYGRGLIADVSQRFTEEFAACLAAHLAAAEQPGAPPPPAAPSKPIAGIRLALWAAVRGAGRLLGRILKPSASSRSAAP